MEIVNIHRTSGLEANIIGYATYELKAHRLDYADVAQLNMYIEYYRKHYMQPDDNPPVGLLLCTEYGQEMVEYLTPFTDPQLFVARYELQLPSKEKIRKFLMQENGNTKR